MLFSELQVVRTLRELRDDDDIPIPVGTVGTIVSVYSGAYCVEFPQGLGDVVGSDLILAAATFKLDIHPTRPGFKGGRAFVVDGYDQRDFDAIFAKLDDWCAQQWETIKWNRMINCYNVASEAMAFEFRMRWHGIDFDGLFPVQHEL